MARKKDVVLEPSEEEIRRYKVDVCLHDDSKPIFEVRSSEGRAIKVYSSGKIEGFPKEYSIIINRAARLISKCEALLRKEEADGKK